MNQIKLKYSIHHLPEAIFEDMRRPVVEVYLETF